MGVVLRRGPTDWARLSVWHTNTDTFEHGQWIHGRVYERRSDLSPDGSLFIYFVLKIGGRRGTHPRWQDTWIAISKPPRFTASALWFVGGTYCTGGFFPAADTVWTGGLGQPPDVGRIPRGLTLSTSQDFYIDRTNNWPERTVHVNRLLRDGWKHVPNAAHETWERRSPLGTSTLLMAEEDFDFRAFGGPYVMRYSVRWEPDSKVVDLGYGTWADWDQSGRLLLGQDGRLFVAESNGARQELANLNSQLPEPVP